MISLGTSARILREKLGISQHNVAMALGVTEAEVSEIESDQIPLTDELLDRYLNLWGIDLPVLAWCESPDYSGMPKSMQRIAAEIGELWQEDVEEALDRHAQARAE